jgi:hypothetical protein
LSFTISRRKDVTKEDFVTHTISIPRENRGAAPISLAYHPFLQLFSPPTFVIEVEAGEVVLGGQDDGAFLGF